MTPEERARHLATELYALLKNATLPWDEIEALVAAAIREAVDAETEACAQLAERCECGEAMYDGCRASGPNGTAKALRQRAASRAKPAP